jgi:FMN phosphatase YigB (HAD superfamily)
MRKKMRNNLKKKIKAILFDLDGTLIDCDVNLFTRNYLNGLSKALSPFIPPKKTLLTLLQASKEIENSDGLKINFERFEEIFFSATNQPREVINPIIDKFYETEFPKLKENFTVKPLARVLMKKTFNKDYKVVIATTPLLPEIAIVQRLKWAGVGEFPYDFITTIENCRTSKTLSSLLYYEDILEKLDLPAESCLMVGDEAKDMIAAKLGCITFLIEGQNNNLDDSIPLPTFKGTLADLIKLI